MTTDTDQQGDVAAALAYAEDNHQPATVDLGDRIKLVRLRAGETWQKHDVGDRSRPERARGTIDVYDAESFATSVQQREAALADVVVYVNEDTCSLTAVLNDDFAGSPGWRDHRVDLALRATPEWRAWVGGEGLGGQERFAQRIEDGEPEIVQPDGKADTPSAADLLDIAQTFKADTEVKFKQGTRLQNGAVQLTYEENVTASAGGAGKQVTIPEVFYLGVRPFIGSPAFEVKARLRWRIKRGNAGGELEIGYLLFRPEEVLRHAFLKVADELRLLLDGATFIAGPAPSEYR